MIIHNSIGNSRHLLCFASKSNNMKCKIVIVECILFFGSKKKTNQVQRHNCSTVIPHQGGGHTYSCRGLAGTPQQSLGALWGSLGLLVKQEGAQMLVCRKALAPSIRSGVLGCWSRSDVRLRFMRDPSPHSRVATQPTAHRLKFTCSLLSPPPPLQPFADLLGRLTAPCVLSPGGATFPGREAGLNIGIQKYANICMQPR